MLVSSMVTKSHYIGRHGRLGAAREHLCASTPTCGPAQNDDKAGGMHDLGQALLAACRLIVSLDPELIGIVALSLEVSLSATVIAMLIGAPAGAALALT